MPIKDLRLVDVKDIEAVRNKTTSAKESHQKELEEEQMKIISNLINEAAALGVFYTNVALDERLSKNISREMMRSGYTVREISKCDATDRGIYRFYWGKGEDKYEV